MRKEISHIIKSVVPGSIAWELELAPGDRLLAINGKEIGDVFDYHFLVNDDYLVLLVQKKDGEEWELEIEKNYDEDLGLEFENGLMDEYRSCSNHCMFCFIDQMPPGMRETLYFKDDDSRLSFLQGNYVTLTNMKDKDLERIISYHMDPINISVHTTNPELRCRMLGNRFAGQALAKMDRLHEAGILMNGQIVLCKGINDGEELERTIGDLTRYLPNMRSLSVVPVGLTRYREGLYPLEPFGKEDARQVIGMIEHWQQWCMDHHGVHFVQASDEWYLTAGLPLPEADRYDGYLQLENGVGMLRLLMEEFAEALREDTLKRGASTEEFRGEAHKSVESTEEFREEAHKSVKSTEEFREEAHKSVELTEEFREEAHKSVELTEKLCEEMQRGTDSMELLREEIHRNVVSAEPLSEEVCKSVELMEELREDAKKSVESTEELHEIIRPPGHKVTIATGRLAAPFIGRLAADFMECYPEIVVEVVAIRNDFFGERITVSGLITGKDLIAQLQERCLGDKLAIPSNMLRMGEEVFLDDITVADVENALQVPLDIVKSSGWDLFYAMRDL